MFIEIIGVKDKITLNTEHIAYVSKDGGVETRDRMFYKTVHTYDELKQKLIEAGVMK